ncbi:peptidoglycan-binding protein [Candidatus Kaiserbacteria bacterium]|nr:peptidoglycan-binding protein [Candidatus Kaiserbacteria bacterium]MCB9811647.1 peptidoglycan-binding protein [Candidatus Nomurabacteria bacterium]
MTIVANNIVAKLAVAFVAVAMAVALVAPSAKAETADELQSMIDSLLSQIASLQAQLGQGGSSSSCVSIPAPLTIGAQNANVTALQNFLISEGQSIPAGATGYFGSQTQAALAGWQAANGVSPAVGYYGPITKAAVDAKCASMDDSDDDMSDDDDMSGGKTLGNDEGDIASIDQVSADESNLEEGTEGGVLGFTAEIEGDVMIDRIDVYTAENGSGSDDADDYFQTASLWVDGEKVAELDVDDFDQDDYAYLGLDGDDYRLRFSDLGLVFEDGDEPEFQVAFEMNNNLDSSDLTTDWDVALQSIRYKDGKGFTDTWTDSSSPLNDANETFGFNAEDVAELDITKSSDSPDATTLEVDTDDTSKEHELLVVDIEEQNGVDVTINKLTMTASTTDTDVTSTIDEVILYVDGDEVGSDSPSASGALEFKNLGIDIDADDTVQLTAKVVFNGTDDYTEGDEVFLTFNAVTDAEDANGNDEGDITGSNPTDFSSDTFTLRSEGLALELVSVDEEKDAASFSGDTDTGIFTFEIEVTAFGANFYMDEDAANVDFDLLVGGSAVAAASSTATLDISGADTAGVADYKIAKGDTVTLTLTVETASDVSGSAKVRVNSVAYSAADDANEELTETAAPAADWTSSSLILN